MDSIQKSFLEKHKSVVAMNELLPPLFYRIYKSTVQRQLVDMKALNSHAAYLIVLDDERQVLGWVGSSCEEQDVEILQDLAKDVMTRDYGDDQTDEIAIIYEKFDTTSPLLESMMDMLNSSSTAYFAKSAISERRKLIENNPISVGIVEPLHENSSNEKEITSFDLRETSFAHPDPRGAVPRVAFSPLETDTLVYLTIGDQWDLWIARGVANDVIDASIAFLENIIESQLSEILPNFDRDMIKQYLQVTYQGEERVCFRRPLKIFTDFEPPGKTIEKEKKIAESGIKQAIERRLNDRKASRKFSSFFNDIRMEAETYDENDPDNPNNANNSSNRKVSFFQSSPNLVTTPMNNSSSQHHIGPLPDRVDFYQDVTPAMALEANCAFLEKLPENVQQKHTDIMSSIQFEEQQLPEIVADDVHAITGDLVHLIDAQNIGIAERKELINKSVVYPNVLLGWQVSIHFTILSF